MILDGIENCITYIDNFDPEKSKNPLHTLHRLHTMHLLDVSRKRKADGYEEKYIGSLDIQELLDSSADGNEHNSEYLDYIRKAVDESASLEEKFADQKSKLKKRRPKYLDDKEALKMAKEKSEVMQTKVESK